MSGNMKRLIAGGLAGCLLALGVSAAERSAESSVAGATPAALMRRAAAAESAQRTNEAVEAYEQLLRQDASFDAVVAQRLVALYCGAGQAAPALAWAARAARRSPDPKAYLAGVYARLGLWKESELLLRQTLSGEQEPRKRVQFLWQLAEAQERQGEGEAALAALTAAHAAAPGTALQKTSVQRLDALRHRLSAAQTKQPHARGTPPAEETR